MTHPIRRVKLRDQVAERIATMVLSDEYAMGDRLPPERKLVEDLGVSRTVVREALNALESRGLVRIEHGRGAVVAGDGSPAVRDTLQLYLRSRPETMLELLEVRRALEVEVAGLAAERATPEDVEGMREANDRMGERLDSPEEYAKADTEFHALLARSTKNHIFLLMNEPINDLLLASRKITGSLPENARRAVKGHEVILGSIEARDVPGARRAMVEHLFSTQKDVEKLIEDG
ncbi:MAG: FadR family transcriptional regulator [Actinomycetota bacterium]|jgi:GntR family transcriptional repressor for pyruvate dehydrogenase complex|nr:FadR family transcriptional regulator [Actinomycetota bacterium]MDP9484298.1 FadR family transcriptional regulator [Actinomycetota bacterium]